MNHKLLLSATALLLVSLACSLPGTASPTPFTFPTPNQTLTAIYQPTASATTPAVSQTPVVSTTEGATPTPAASGPAVTATPTTSAATGRRSGSLFTAPQVASPPDIDGALDDWPDQRHPITEAVYGLANWSGGADLSGSFAVAWDGDNLYLAIEVNDDAFVQTASGRTLFRGDSAEILFDQALTADFHSTSLSSDDYQIGLSPGNFDGLSPEAYRWFPASVEGRLTTTEVAAVETGDGYVIEASIPWIALNVNPAVSGRYGFALSLSDNDQAGTAQQQSMVSSASGRSLADPTTWGTLVLAERD